MPLEMRASSASSRGKACVACTHAKRRCDRRRQGCERCIDRDIDCVYPQPKNRRRGLLEQTGPIHYAPPGDPSIKALEAWSRMELGSWAEFNAAGSTAELALPGMPADLHIIPGLPAASIDANRGGWLMAATQADTKWFLEPGTWSIEHLDKDGPTTSTSVFKDFLKGVQAMLREWVREGSNGFIHAKLYRTGLPRCLQDAYTTLTAYISRTSATEELVLQIAEDRATALVTQPLPSGDLQANLLAHLARVQALFIYQIIRLLDGCIQQRVRAEGSIRLLYSWIGDMWQAASVYQASLHLSNPPAGEETSEHSAGVALWSAWLLTESVRRTFLVAGFTLSVYTMLRDGWTECLGGVMVTARKGLWEAQSASRWLELCAVRDPWLVSSVTGQSLFVREQMEDVDDFLCHLWTLTTEEEKVQGWIDRSKSRLGIIGL